MQYHHQTVSVHFVQALINAVERRGGSANPLLQSARISREVVGNPQLRITPEQFSRLVLEIWQQSDDEFLGLSLHPARLGTFTLMAKYAVHCATLNDVYRHLCHFYNTVSDAVTLDFRAHNGKFCLATKLKNPELDRDHILLEILSMIWHRFSSWLIGRRIPLDHMTFAFAEPAHAIEYKLLFPCPVHFDQTENLIVLDSEHLCAPVIQTASTLRNYLRRAPLDWFSRQNYYPTITRKVIDRLEQDGQFFDRDMEEVARELNITSRTLRRKLTEERTSFQTLKDTLRRDTAIHCLSEPRLPLSVIAERLAFSDPAAFSRAFKSWTGVTPRHYRKL